MTLLTLATCQDYTVQRSTIRESVDTQEPWPWYLNMNGDGAFPLSDHVYLLVRAAAG